MKTWEIKGFSLALPSWLLKVPVNLDAERDHKSTDPSRVSRPPRKFIVPGPTRRSDEICPGLHAAAKIAKSAKNWKIRRVSKNPAQKGVEKAPTRIAIFEKTAKIANIVRSAKNWKIRRVSENR